MTASEHDTSNSAGTPGVTPPGFLVRFVATGAFSGYSPWASGTAGTFVGCLVLLVPGIWSLVPLSLLIIIFFFAGTYTAGRIAAFEGNRLTASAAKAKATFQPGSAEHADPSIVVIDEIVGVWITLLFIHPSLLALAAGFVFFRLFDIVKPPPVHTAESLPSGWGIMLDDVIAGVYATIATYLSLAVLTLVHLV